MGLDEELRKAKEDLERNPPLSRKDYEEALKVLAKKRGMTVEEFKRMLDEGGC